MKFAIVSSADLSRPYGGQKIALEMHNHLIRLGHKSFFISPNPSRKLKTKVLNNFRFGSIYDVASNESTSSIDFESFRDNKELCMFLDRYKFDVICLHEPGQPFLSWDVLKHSNSINIGWFHSTTRINFSSFPYNLLMQPLKSWLDKKLHGLIAVSPSAKKTWNTLFENRGVIIPGGVNLERFYRAKKIKLSKLPKILFVGRLDKRKGVDHAIKTFNHLINSLNFEAKLFIVGDGPMRKEAEKLVSDFGLKGLVEFVGRVSDKELPSYYKSCDVYIAPSTVGESLGIVILEAMAAGIPVIAYANSGYKFTLKGSPWSRSLVKVGDYEGLAKAVAVLLEEKEVVNKLLRWQRKRIKYFSWDNVMKMFLGYVEEVRGKHLLS